VYITGGRLTGVLLTDADLGEVEIEDCRLDGIRGATGLNGVTMRWDDVVANAGVFAAACGVRMRSD